MQKLLAAYKKQPSPSTRNKLQAYLDMYVFEICLVTIEDFRFLRDNEFRI